MILVIWDIKSCHCFKPCVAKILMNLVVVEVYVRGGSRGVRWVRTNPPSALGYYELVQQLATEFTYRNNDDRLNGTPQN